MGPVVANTQPQTRSNTPHRTCRLPTYSPKLAPTSDGTCRLPTYSPKGGPTAPNSHKHTGECWSEFGAVCWQITGSMGHVGASLGLYVGNLQVLWGLLDRLWGRMLATYMSQGACWSELGAVCWQPTGLMGPVGPPLGPYVGNLHVPRGMLERAWGCMLATIDIRARFQSKPGTCDVSGQSSKLSCLAFGYSFNQSLEDAMLASIVFRH